MDREKLEKEINELLSKMSVTKAGSQEYDALVNELRDLYDILSKDDEFAYKMKEYYRQIDADEESLRANDKDSELKAKTIRTQSRNEIIKACVSGVFSVAAIVLVGNFEETKILAKNMFALASKLLPRL